jgi:hypothetical protein
LINITFINISEVQVFGDSYYRFKKKHEQGEELARQEINREKLSETIKQSHITY